MCHFISSAYAHWMCHCRDYLIDYQWWQSTHWCWWIQYIHVDTSLSVSLKPLFGRNGSVLCKTDSLPLKSKYWNPVSPSEELTINLKISSWFHSVCKWNTNVKKYEKPAWMDLWFTCAGVRRCYGNDSVASALRTLERLYLTIKSTSTVCLDFCINRIELRCGDFLMPVYYSFGVKTSGFYFNEHFSFHGWKTVILKTSGGRVWSCDTAAWFIEWYMVKSRRVG